MATIVTSIDQMGPGKVLVVLDDRNADGFPSVTLKVDPTDAATIAQIASVFNSLLNPA